MQTEWVRQGAGWL